MKRSFLLAAVLCLTALLDAPAQQRDIFRQLQDHPEYLDGTDYLCPTGPSALTKAPRGYKAFYISHCQNPGSW